MPAEMQGLCTLSAIVDTILNRPHCNCQLQLSGVAICSWNWHAQHRFSLQPVDSRRARYMLQYILCVMVCPSVCNTIQFAHCTNTLHVATATHTVSNTCEHSRVCWFFRHSVLNTPQSWILTHCLLATVWTQLCVQAILRIASKNRDVHPVSILCYTNSGISSSLARLSSTNSFHCQLRLDAWEWPC